MIAFWLKVFNSCTLNIIFDTLRFIYAILLSVCLIYILFFCSSLAAFFCVKQIFLVCHFNSCVLLTILKINFLSGALGYNMYVNVLQPVSV